MYKRLKNKVKIQVNFEGNPFKLQQTGNKVNIFNKKLYKSIFQSLNEVDLFYKKSLKVNVLSFKTKVFFIVKT